MRLWVIEMRERERGGWSEWCPAPRLFAGAISSNRPYAWARARELRRGDRPIRPLREYRVKPWVRER